MMMNKNKIPHQYDQTMFDFLIQGLRELGGSASRDEITHKVADLLDLTEDERSFCESGKSNSLFPWRLSWTRWALDKADLIDGSQRGVWALSPKGWQTKQVDRRAVIKAKNEYMREAKKISQSSKNSDNKNDALPQDFQWKEDVISYMKNMNPYSFEILCRDLLRKLGLSEVEVTSKSNDGGIDGYGIVKIQGIVSFKLAFQCKRYKGIISSKDIQAFKGAITGMLDGRIEKSLFITTGVFSPQAKKEAEKLSIDLLDGESLVDKMADLKLGVKEKLVLDEDYFAKLKQL